MGLSSTRPRKLGEHPSQSEDKTSHAATDSGPAPGAILIVASLKQTLELPHSSGRAAASPYHYTMLKNTQHRANRKDLVLADDALQLPVQ